VLIEMCIDQLRLVLLVSPQLQRPGIATFDLIDQAWWKCPLSDGDGLEDDNRVCRCSGEFDHLVVIPEGKSRRSRDPRGLAN
jgi:hypothetical protein